MTIRVLVGLAAAMAAASTAAAQTTVTLNQPTAIVSATIRGGSYADTNNHSLLATRSSDNLEYERRVLLKFDTQNTIPAGASVTSAKLTVTVKTGGADATRNVGAYQITTSWDETQVTWNDRRTSEPWSTSGGDLGAKLATATVGNTDGAKATFDVTALVKLAAAGSLGSSRYTRIALIDLDGSTSDSYREYHLQSDTTTSTRPTLVVTYGTSTSTSSTSTGGTTLRVLQWNTHHGGYRTDGVWDPKLLMSWVAKINPDIVSLNEVEYGDSYSQGGDDAALFASYLKTMTGKTWYHTFVVGSGASTGIGNAILSKIPFDATDRRFLSYGRVIVDATITVNGRTVNVFSTHLDANSSSYRLKEIGELTTWASGIAQQRIVCGDFNASPGSTENSTMKQSYYDSWAVAQANGTAIAYPGNEDGNTRNSRIDYIYYSRSASELVLKSSQVFDTRDANGVMPSDHRPVLSIFTVK